MRQISTEILDTAALAPDDGKPIYIHRSRLYDWANGVYRLEQKLDGVWVKGVVLGILIGVLFCVAFIVGFRG